jgi:hypothetical protein
MALNPFFLQGSPNEQRLVQELINEQLRMYGVEVYYIPRKYVRRETILREVTSSKFNDNYAIEAYINNYEGYTGQGDLLTKFGMSLKDEVSLIISKERFEDFISPFLESDDDTEITLTSRPREGDLVYFPLGQRLFEVKFVEHEQPFYQLGKLYVYELRCELFEYEDEIGGWENDSTTVQEIDNSLEQFGYMTELQLFSTSVQETATSLKTSGGYVRRIILNNDGYGYIGSPTVSISTAPAGGTNATAVAITTSLGGSYSIKEILLTNAGSGYTAAPIVTISGGNGVGAAATSEIVSNAYCGVKSVSITGIGTGYVSAPTITFSSPTNAPNIRAQGKAVVSSAGTISQILISNAGAGYSSSGTISVTIAAPPATGIGTYQFNEVAIGASSGTRGRVKSWDYDTKILKIGVTDGAFQPGEVIVGSASSARYSLLRYQRPDTYDKYEQNDEIETEADLIVDFSESNPFGNY